MKLYWHHKKKKLSYDQAINRILSIGFTSANRGYEKVLKNGNRLHIISHADYFSIHIDDSKHNVVGGAKVDKKLRETIAELEGDMFTIRKQQFKKKIVSLLKLLIEKIER